MSSLGGIGLTPFRTEAPRLIVPDEVDFSDSGGGVGGKTLRFNGGSDCCRLLWRPGFTRFVAAKDKLSAGRSSLTSAGFKAWID
jgi:hypothetical protein